MKLKLFFAWYDIWIGFYWDRKTKTLYTCLLPTIVIAVEFYIICPKCKKRILGSCAVKYCGTAMCYDCKTNEEYFDEEYR